MRALLTTNGSRADVEPIVGRAVQLGPLGAQVRVAPESDAPVATGEMPTGPRP